MKEFIFLNGPTGVGKTTLAKKLHHHYQGVYIEQHKRYSGCCRLQKDMHLRKVQRRLQSAIFFLNDPLVVGQLLEKQDDLNQYVFYDTEAVCRLLRLAQIQCIAFQIGN